MLSGSPRRLVVFQGTLKVLLNTSELKCSSFCSMLVSATEIASTISMYDVKLSSFQGLLSTSSKNATEDFEVFFAYICSLEMNSKDTLSELASERRRLFVKLLSSDDGNMFMRSKSHGGGSWVELFEELDANQHWVVILKVTSNLGRPIV